MSARARHVSRRQTEFFESARATFQQDTGRTLEAWVEIARTCPETTPFAQQRWLHDKHGLAANFAWTVLEAAFPSPHPTYDRQEDLRDWLWADARARAIFERFAAAARKTLHADPGHGRDLATFHRRRPFAAARPLEDGRVLVGLALDAAVDPRLSPRGAGATWHERLTSELVLASPDEVDATLERLMRQAWDRS